MIGSKSFTIDWKDFVKGVSTSPDISDGGFSDETWGVNLVTKPGLIYAPAQATEVTTAPTGTIIASCGGYNSLTQDRYFVADNRTHYTYNGTNLTLQHTASSGTYTDGKTDMAGFVTSIYISTTTHLTKWNGTTTLNETFYAFANSSSPHPVIVFQGDLWFGDGNLLKKMDSSESFSTPLTLETGTQIYALGIDPATGRLLVSTSDALNMSDSLKAVNKVFIYDGFNTVPNRTIIVEDLVTAFYPHSSVVYTPYGRNLGYFTGSGIEFLRTLKNVTFSNDSLVYKHRITSIANRIYIANGSEVLCYGEIIGKQPKVFHPAYRNSPSGTARQISCLTALGNPSGTTGSKLGIACNDNSTYRLRSFSVSDRTTAQNHLFYTNRYSFNRPVYLRGVRVIFDGNIPTSGGTLGYISYLSELGASTVQDIATVTDATPWTDFQAEQLVNSFKFIIEWSTSSTVFGVRALEVFYDIAE